MRFTLLGIVTGIAIAVTAQWTAVGAAMAIYPFRMNLQAEQPPPDALGEAKQPQSTPNGEKHDRPTPAQMQTAEIAAASAATKVAELKVAEKEAQNSWNIVLTAFFAFVSSGGLATFVVQMMKTRNELKLKEAQENARIANTAMELKAKLGIDEDNAVISSMKTEIQRLQGQIDAAVAREMEMQTQINKLNEMIGWAQQHGNDCAFIQWSKDTNGFITSVSPAFERQILNPIGMTVGQIIGRKIEDIWPDTLGKALGEIDDAGRTSPDHTAWKENIVFDPRLPDKYMVAKTVLRFRDRPVGLSGVAFAMKSKIAV